MNNVVDLLLNTDVDKIERPSKEVEVTRLSNLLGDKFIVVCKGLSYDKYSEIEESCLKIKGKDADFNVQKLQMELVFNGVFSTDGSRLFSNKKIQEKFKAPNGKELIKKLLLSGEIAKLADTITDLTGYGDSTVEEVKN